jgi:transcriptional regulator with XRE-family HTH domain
MPGRTASRGVNEPASRAVKEPAGGAVDGPAGGRAFGQRLRELRRARGWSQQQLAGDGVSASHISLIEAGRRRPSATLLEHLARRLGLTVAQLLADEEPAPQSQAHLTLDYAELALRHGEADECRRQAEQVLAQAGLDGPTANRARWLAAGAAEATGALRDAIALLEQLYDDGERWLDAGLALARCYRELGDLAYSVDVGERLLGRLRQTGLEQTTQAVEAMTMLAGSLYERGDLHRARAVARQAMTVSELVADPASQAKVLWNASLVEAGLGHTGSALHLSRRALALLAESDQARHLARLRVAHAWLLLQQRDPEVPLAQSLLRQSLAELETHGSATDLGYCLTELARCELLGGDPAAAQEVIAKTLAVLPVDAHLERGRAELLAATALGAQGREDECLHRLRAAAEQLAACHASRQAAGAWRDLAEAYLSAGHLADGIQALRTSAELAGVRSSLHAPAHTATA